MRDSSSRSPVIVSTRNPASQGTNFEMSQPASHSPAAATQQTAADASTALCSEGWIRWTATNIATSITPPQPMSASPTFPGAPMTIASPPRASGDRCQVSPGFAERHRALQGDQRPEKPENHELAVVLAQGGAACRDRQAEVEQSFPQAGEEHDDRGGDERRHPGRPAVPGGHGQPDLRAVHRFHPSWSLAQSLIIASGSHGGSQTICTSTPDTPGTSRRVSWMESVR